MPFIEELLGFIGNIFVETGTFQGETVQAVLKDGVAKQIISLELSDVFYARCCRKFKNNLNVKIYKANSKYDLFPIIKNITEEITFWLDSHWCGQPDVGYDEETICPILFELEQIKQHSIKTHTIIVDDLRLMNMQDFPVSLDQVKEKILEINPNYTLYYLDDNEAKADILVARVEKICVHKYLTACRTNPQPPGIADFLRGTVALFYYSKQYNYEFYIDGTHPLFSFLQPNNRIVQAFDLTVHELIPPMQYSDIDAALKKLFEKKENFTVITNCLYQKIEDTFFNYGPIRQDARGFLQDILKPNEVIQKKISFIFETVYKINPASKFKVIHLRFGDKFINTTETIPTDIYLTHYIKLLNIISHSEEPCVLMSDATIIARQLKKDLPQLLYWDNHKIHLGSLEKDPSEGIIDTLVDFFIISKASEIYSVGSGFAAIISEIYGIKYTSY